MDLRGGANEGGLVHWNRRPRLYISGSGRNFFSELLLSGRPGYAVERLAGR